jgi:uncharacterized membrane protein (DUF2068 family)
MDWSLLACGRSGHVTYAPDEPEVRQQLSAETPAGQAWRCLRCATFVAGPPGATGPAASAPRVRRGKEVRSALILRVFAVERYLRALLFLGLAIALWQFKHSQASIEATFDKERPILRELFRQLGFNIDHSKLVGLIQHALTLSPHALTLLALGLAAYAAIEIVEGTGLWLGRRWGEYFAMVATSLGLPLEIYDLTRKVTVTALIFLAVNLLLVLYLVVTKRLFGVRGGKRAYDAMLRSESLMATAIEAAAPPAGGLPIRQPRTSPVRRPQPLARPTARRAAARPPTARPSTVRSRTVGPSTVRSRTVGPLTARRQTPGPPRPRQPPPPRSPGTVPRRTRPDPGGF